LPESNPYEAEHLLAEYLLFHYGERARLLPYDEAPIFALDYVRRVVDPRLNGVLRPNRPGRFLDLGCAVGASSFALAGEGRQVVGIDYSRSFIEAAQALQRGESLQSSYLVEGDHREPWVVHPPPGKSREGVSFEVGDAMNLRPDLGEFDGVIAINLVCRLTHPMRLLERLPALVKPGGFLLLNTPHSWMESFTPKVNWPGQAEGRSAQAGLDNVLEKDFQLHDRCDMPFLIREHARKFQFTYAASSLWIRR
jgi:putative 4-mercaptohistidine N1-methyltranferase